MSLSLVKCPKTRAAGKNFQNQFPIFQSIFGKWCKQAFTLSLLDYLHSSQSVKLSVVGFAELEKIREWVILGKVKECQGILCMVMEAIKMGQGE